MPEEFKNSEIVIGLVAPVGVNLDLIEEIIKGCMKQFKYEVQLIKLSNLIKKVPGIKAKINEDTEYNRINSLMTAGNVIREKAKYKDVHADIHVYGVLSAIAMSDIRTKRKYTNKNGKIEFRLLDKTAHIISSLKHPDEVMLLRYTYSHGFFLLGITSSEENRRKTLIDQKGMTRKEANKLIKRDQEEIYEYGQHTRAVFELADGFIDIDSQDYIEQIGRILDLIFRNPHITPTLDELAMYLAYSSSLRSADLSRQVGAVIVSKDGDIVSIGANDVPKFGGGLYWPNDKGKCRDVEKKKDSNQLEKHRILRKIMKKISKEIAMEIKNSFHSKSKKEKNLLTQTIDKFSARFQNAGSNKLIAKGKKWLKETGVLDITEYGRAVHAEMEALLSCARSGVSPRGGTLYSTTFPCHNCAKHIVDSGIKRVVFVEPYPKSKAKDLHKDSIHLPHENSKPSSYSGKVSFEPFVGVGHRRFYDLFSMKSSIGNTIKRKDDQTGRITEWKRSNTYLRVPLLPASYIDREGKSVRDFLELDFIKKRVQRKKIKSVP